MYSRKFVRAMYLKSEIWKFWFLRKFAYVEHKQSFFKGNFFQGWDQFPMLKQLHPILSILSNSNFFFTQQYDGRYFEHFVI